MSQSDLARRMDAPRSSVSSWARGARVPDVESCFRIADALDLLPIDVMRIAGHPVDDEPGPSELEDRLVGVWRRLTPEGQEAAVEFVEFLRGRERRRE